MNTLGNTDVQLEENANQTPIACLLSPEEQAVRRVEVGDRLIQARQVRELMDGYEFRYDATEELVSQIVACVMFERVCCPFLTFELIFAPDLGPLWLRLRGPADVKEFIKVAMLPVMSLDKGTSEIYSVPS